MRMLSAESRGARMKAPTAHLGTKCLPTRPPRGRHSAGRRWNEPPHIQAVVLFVGRQLSAQQANHRHLDFDHPPAYLPQPLDVSSASATNLDNRYTAEPGTWRKAGFRCISTAISLEEPT
eukprot:6207574-Pleurochrysis_carterae.AAC.2